MAQVKELHAPRTLNDLAVAPPALTFVSYSDLMAWQLPEREWIIPGVLPVGLVSAIVAESGTGKSWLALSLMRCIAAGDMWAGKFECAPRRCGFLDLEGDYVGLKSRLDLLNRGMGAPTPAARDSMFFLSDLGRVDVMQLGTVPRIAAAVRERELSVMFVDTLIRTHTQDENSAAMGDVMEALEKVSRETGCTVIVLHHTGKGFNGKPATGRGSSAIKAALQHELMLTKETDGAAKIALTKAKSAPERSHLTTMTIRQLDSGGVSIEYSDEVIGLKEPGRPSAREDRRKAAIDLLTDRPMSYKALVDGVMAKARCGRTTATDEIAAMLKDQLIAKKGEVYCMADEV